MIRILLAAVALAGAAPAFAADRTFTVTSFDRIRVEGPFAVTVVSGGSPGVRASGSPQALDSVEARVEGQTLTIRRNTNSGWGNYPGSQPGPVTIAVSTASLRTASLTGSGALTIDRMRDARIDLLSGGSGSIAVGHVETDQLNAGVAGSGAIHVAGTAAIVRIVVRGSGDVDAASLTAADAEVTSDGAGAVTLAARRSAKVTANGTGNVTVTGDAACTVRAQGSGTVICGH